METDSKAQIVGTLLEPGMLVIFPDAYCVLIEKHTRNPSFTQTIVWSSLVYHIDSRTIEIKALGLVKTIKYTIVDDAVVRRNNLNEQSPLF